MSEATEGWWNKHTTGVIQCVLAAYCATLATLEYLRTRPISTSNATSSPSVGAAMTHGYSMPFWLWAGIIGLSLSVAIPAVLGMFRRRKQSADVSLENQKALDELNQLHADEIRRLNNSCEAELFRSREFYRQSEAERREVIKQLEEIRAKLFIFTPLQIEAFTLAKDLKQFHRELKSYPRADESLLNNGGSTPDYLVNFLDTAAQREKYHDQTWHSYASAGFPERVKRLVNEAGAKGIDVKDLERYVTVVNWGEDVTSAINVTQRIAIQLGGI